MFLHQSLTSSAIKFCAIVTDYAVGDAIMVYNPGYEVYHWSGFGRFNWFGFYPFGEFIHHDQQVFFLMASSFKGSYHIEPLDRKGPSYGDCLESGRWHMALICKRLATDAMLDKVLCVCPSCRPVETCTEGLAYERPSCSMVAAESSMNFGQ